MGRENGNGSPGKNRDEQTKPTSPIKGAFDGTTDATTLLRGDEWALLPKSTRHGRLGYAILYVFARQYRRFPNPSDDLELLVRTVAAALAIPINQFPKYDLQSRTAKRHRTLTHDR